MLKLVYILALAIFLAEVNANPIEIKTAVATEFLILHNNDMHARFEQTSVDSGTCLPQDANSNKCYGGFARVAYEVRKYRAEAKKGGLPVLYLNAGDTYTGTPWFTVFKDKIASAFLNKLQPDAISLGNHEFDENVEGLVPFLNEVDFPVLAANLELKNAPEILATKHFANSTVLEVNGTKVGVIGYLTPDTKYLVAPNTVDYKPEIDCINEEAAKMKAAGIKIILALGHSGYQKDQDIAANCPDIDVVIGGHTNTFLYNGEQPDAEHIDGPYPTVVKQKSGKEVPVVQAYAYTKYLGKLHLQFDEAGNLLEFNGTPLLLNASVPREDDVLQLLEVYRPKIEALEKSVVGHTKVPLQGGAQSCRTKECNFGNLIADSMVFGRVLEIEDTYYWTDAAIAFIQGGGIRSSIQKRNDGSVMESDVLTVLPFSNDLYITSISGRTLRKTLEHSATIRNRDSNGGFLQMSGVHVTYDYRRDEGERVTSVEVRCAECEVPVFEPLNDSKFYKIILPEFLLKGGDGHSFAAENGFTAIRMQRNDEKTLIQFLQQRDIVYPEIEGRITIIETMSDSAGSLVSSLAMLIACILSVRYVF